MEVCSSFMCSQVCSCCLCSQDSFCVSDSLLGFYWIEPDMDLVHVFPVQKLKLCSPSLFYPEGGYTFQLLKVKMDYTNNLLHRSIVNMASTSTRPVILQNCSIQECCIQQHLEGTTIGEFFKNLATVLPKYCIFKKIDTALAIVKKRKPQNSRRNQSGIIQTTNFP
ncbi:hypothetical protein ACJIZ3_011216 [Penstemon smallii]|uniref:Uncharacterized protein n=1 Tax=Penstemon smallii TaxID=265156 RepID=A0ABD3UIH8_9LAMI